MKKFLQKFKKDLKENWVFYLVEILVLLFFEFFVLKLDPLKVVIITFGVILISLVSVVIFGIKDVLKNWNVSIVIYYNNNILEKFRGDVNVFSIYRRANKKV